MHRILVIVLLAVFVLSACTTRFMDQSERVPAKARISVLTVNKNGEDITTSLNDPYVYNILIKHGFVPVALNEAAVYQLYRPELSGDDSLPLPIGGGDARIVKEVMQTNAGEFNPILVPGLLDYLKKQKLDYLLLLHVEVVAMDERVHALLIRVDDASVVSSTYYSYSFMKPFCIPMTLALGASLLICPWMYLRNTSSAKYELVDDLLSNWK